MKRTVIVFIFIVALVQACTKGPTEVASSEGAGEAVRLVMYFSDDAAGIKTVGDWMLIDTGELLQVQQNAIEPAESLRTHDWNGVFLPLIEGPKQAGHVDLKLDRRKGVVCQGSRCALLYALCPPNRAVSKSNPCQVFSRS